MAHDRSTFVMLKNKVIRVLRKAKADCFITIIENAQGNSKTKWRQIKKCTRKNNIKARPIELKINYTILQSPIDVAQAFNQYFIDSVDKITQSCKVQQPYLRTSKASETALVGPVTKLDVEKIVMSLKSSMAKYFFSIETLLLKQISSSIVNPVTHIINSSLDQGRFPTSWKPTVVAPIFKGGYPHFNQQL